MRGEVERRLWTEFLVSPLGNREIVWQKLGARALPVALAMAAAAPFLLLCRMFGGVSDGELVIAALRCVVIGAFALSLFFVGGLERTRGSSVARWWGAALFTPWMAFSNLGCAVAIALFGASATGLLWVLPAVFPQWWLFVPPEETRHSMFTRWPSLPFHDALPIGTLLTLTLGNFVHATRILRTSLTNPAGPEAPWQEFHRHRGSEAERRELLHRVGSNSSGSSPVSECAATSEPGEESLAVTPATTTSAPTHDVPTVWKPNAESPIHNRVDRWILRRLDHPMLDRAARSKPPLEDMSFAFAWIGAAMGAMVLIMLVHGLAIENPRIGEIYAFPAGMTSLGFFLLALRLVPLLGAAFARARATGMWESLRASPLSSAEWLRGLFLEITWPVRGLAIPGIGLSLLFVLLGQGALVAWTMLWSPLLVLGLAAWSFVLGSFANHESTARWLCLGVFLILPFAPIPFSSAFPSLFTLFSWSDPTPLKTGLLRGSLVGVGLIAAYWRCSWLWRRGA